MDAACNQNHTCTPLMYPSPWTERVCVLVRVRACARACVCVCTHLLWAYSFATEGPLISLV